MLPISDEDMDRAVIPMTPLEIYKEHLKSDDFHPDPIQESGVKLTQALFEALSESSQNTESKGLLSFFKKDEPTKIKGLYFWGGVGRGKSFLIDSFFDCLPFAEKKRIHFNHFMHDIHGQLRILPKTPDPLVVVAKNYAERYRLLCIDEFHVDDITDAMIMAGLLQSMFDEGIVLATTSNIKPEDLYQNGLQRDRFLPAIELILENTTVFHLDSNTDYRLQLLEQQGTYHTCAPHESNDTMQAHLDKLANTKVERNTTIVINDREIHCKALSDNLVWFEFSAICQTPRSSSDYINLAREYQTIMVSNIPSMDDGQNDITQRFIQLIDAIYDHKVKFIATALTDPDDLYCGEGLALPFQRIISRLIEMRSAHYLEQAHIAN